MLPDSDDGGSVEAPLSSPACCEWTRSQHVDPVGTAGQYNGFLLIEQPLPWPFDVTLVPELARPAELAMAAGFRAQMVVPVDQPDVGPPAVSDGDGRTAPGGPLAGGEPPRRVICYRSVRPGWAGPMARSERIADVTQLADVTEELLSEAAAPEGRLDHPDGVTDLLVCTHGRRDACCGARGIELINELRREPAVGPGSGVRLWRTSHTGGHRFAPTAVLLPTGTMWAWADPALLRAAVRSDGEVGPWLGRYRGCATLGPPLQQAVERAVLAEVGWAFLSSWRRTADLADGGVSLESGSYGTWEADVREGRHVPQPDCRTPPELAKKQNVEWVVEGLRQVLPT